MDLTALFVLMPCWEVTLVSVELNASNPDLLEQALKALGYQYDRYGQEFSVGGLEIGNGQVKYRDNARNIDKINAIKRQYAIESIKKSAKANGWSGNWQKLNGEQKVNKIELTKGW
jgi:hypothetical protein